MNVKRFLFFLSTGISYGISYNFFNYNDEKYFIYLFIFAEFAMLMKLNHFLNRLKSILIN